MNILIGSLNPVKINATYKAFTQYFPLIKIHEFAVSSLVSSQPIDNEIFIGAKNRCKALAKQNNSNFDADYFVGIESGLIHIYQNWFNIDCVCIMNKKQKINYGLSPAFCLNKKITKQLLQKKELGLIVDNLYNTQNSKQNGGAISLFSKGISSRFEHCYQGVLMALIQFL